MQELGVISTSQGTQTSCFPIAWQAGELVHGWLLARWAWRSWMQRRGGWARASLRTTSTSARWRRCCCSWASRRSSCPRHAARHARFPRGASRSCTPKRKLSVGDLAAQQDHAPEMQVCTTLLCRTPRAPRSLQTARGCATLSRAARRWAASGRAPRMPRATSSRRALRLPLPASRMHLWVSAGLTRHVPSHCRQLLPCLRALPTHDIYMTTRLCIGVVSGLELPMQCKLLEL